MVDTELEKKFREQLRQDRKIKEAFEVLARNDSFQVYLGVLNSMIELRGTDVLAPAGNVDGAVALEYVKGTMYGLILARDLPSVTIASMKDAVVTANDEEDSADV